MQSLGHACIFYTSNPKGQTSCLASYVVAGNSLSLGSIFLISLSNSPNPLSDTPFVAFHCSNSKVVQVSSIHFNNLGTTTYGDPLTTSGTSTSPFHSHSLPAHCAMPAPDRRWDHFLLHLLRALPWEYRPRMHRFQHSGKVVVKIFFFIIFHGNPLFSVLRPTNILLHETICENVAV